MFNRWKSCLVVGCVVAFLVTFPFLSNHAYCAEKTLKIGVAGPLTGGAASIGDNVRMGATIAAEEINAAGGVLGKPIELIFADSEGKPDVGVAAARRLITQDRVKVLMGQYDEVTAMAQYDIALRHKVPILTNGCTAGFMGEEIKKNPKKYRYLWKPVPPGENHSRAFVEVLESIVLDRKIYQPKTTNLTFTTDDTDWAIEHIAAAQKYLDQGRLGKLGWKITYTETYAWGETDFLAIMSKIRAADPGFHVDIDCHIPGCAAFMKQFRDAGIKCPLSMVYLPAAQEFSDITGDAAEGLMYPGVIMIVPTEKGKGLVKKVYEKYGVDIGLEANVGIAHDVVNMVAQAYERAGTLDDVDKFADEMNKTRYNGMCGVYVWDPETHTGRSGEDYIPTQVFQFQNMERVVIWPKRYATGQYQLPDWTK